MLFYRTNASSPTPQFPSEELNSTLAYVNDGKHSARLLRASRTSRTVHVRWSRADRVMGWRFQGVEHGHFGWDEGSGIPCRHGETDHVEVDRRRDGRVTFDVQVDASSVASDLGQERTQANPIRRRNR